MNIEQIISGIPLARLTMICAAEKEGRLIIQPCKIGDTVYSVERASEYEAKKQGIVPNSYGHIKSPDRPFIIRKKNLVKTDYAYKFGRTIFLTYEEAFKVWNELKDVHVLHYLEGKNRNEQA